MEPPATAAAPYIPLRARNPQVKIQPDPALIKDPRIKAVYGWLSEKPEPTFSDMRKIYIIESYFATPKPSSMGEQAFAALQWYAIDIVLDVEFIALASHDKMNKLEEIYRKCE